MVRFYRLIQMVFLTIQVFTFSELKQGMQEFWTQQSAALKNLRFKKQYEVKRGSKKANQIEKEYGEKLEEETWIRKR